MKFFEMHVHSNFSEGFSSLEEICSTLKFLGYKGFCFSIYPEKFSELEKIYKSVESLKERFELEIFVGVEARNLKEIKFLKRRRRLFDLFIVKGNGISLNRAACETKEVDILKPSYNTKNLGIDYVCAKLASKNNISFEINLHEVCKLSEEKRSIAIRNIKEVVFLAKKYEVNLIISSGAYSHWELKDPLALSSFGNQVGLDLKEAKKCVSSNCWKILDILKIRRSEDWIMPGVRLLK